MSLYDRLGDRDGAIDALEQILAADPEDFDVLVRLADLCEEAEKWDRVAELLARRVEVEADESEAAAAAKRRAEILEVRLGREDDALASLEELADHGVQELRDAYVALADRLGWKGLIASKLVHWWLAAPPSPERTSALVEAFHCFVGVDRVEEACRVGLELARGDHLDRALAKTLEGVACADPNALATAHQVLLRGLSGTERMDELLRQAPLADPQRARRLLDEVLRESASPELLASLDALTEDAPKGLRRTLAEALAEAGQGAHDGGRTRGNYLLRAASLARELGELDQVFAWLTEALASCGTLAALDALDALGSAPEILVRVEGALDRAIDEVFDGPLVRELLLRRASLRRGANPEGAVSDLQRLHELLPGDEVVFDQLVELLRQLGDRVRLAALLEEHLGRGQAPASRKKLQELQTALGSIEEAPEPCTRETAAVSEPPSTLAESARTTVPGHRPVNVPPADDDILVVDEFADTVVPEV